MEDDHKVFSSVIRGTYIRSDFLWLLSTYYYQIWDSDMSYLMTRFLLRCCALCKVIEYISSVKEVSSITDCEVRHPLLVDASYKVKTMLLRSHLKSELLKSWHLFLQPGFIFALFMHELVVSSFAYITNDNDQDRLIHVNQTLKNFELSLSLSDMIHLKA